MKNIQDRIRQEIFKKPISENDLEVIRQSIGSTRLHAGPGYYLYDIRYKKVTDTPVHSIADAIKQSMQAFNQTGDPEFYYYNAIVWKDDADMFHLIIGPTGQKHGPFTLEALHNIACDVCVAAYTEMARRANSLKDTGPVDNNTIDGQVNPTSVPGLRMEGRTSKKKVAPLKESSKPSKRLIQKIKR